MLLFFVLAFAIIVLGLKNGIERSNQILMPLLILMSIGISIYALTLPGALSGLAFYLIPDFSKFSVELVNCLGSCALAPVMVVDGTYHNKLRVEQIPGIIESYAALDATATGEVTAHD